MKSLEHKVGSSLNFDKYSARFRPTSANSIASISTDASLSNYSPPKYNMTLKSTPSFRISIPKSKARVPQATEFRHLRITHNSTIPNKPKIPSTIIQPLQISKSRVPSAPKFSSPISLSNLLKSELATTVNKNPTFSFGVSTTQRRDLETQKASVNPIDASRLRYRRYLRALASFESQLVGPLRYRPQHDVVLPSSTMQFASLLGLRTAPRFASSRRQRPNMLEINGDPLKAFMKVQTRRSVSLVRMQTREVSDRERRRRQRGATMDAAYRSVLRGPSTYDISTATERLRTVRSDISVHSWSTSLKKTKSRRNATFTLPTSMTLARPEFWGFKWRKPRGGVWYSRRTISEDPEIGRRLAEHRNDLIQRGRRRGPGLYKNADEDDRRRRERSPAVAFAPRAMGRDDFELYLSRKELQRQWRDSLRGGDPSNLFGKYTSNLKHVKRRVPATDFGKSIGRPNIDNEKIEGDGDTLLLDPVHAWRRLYASSDQGVPDFDKQWSRGRGFSCPPTFEDKEGEGDTLLLHAHGVATRQPIGTMQFDQQVPRGRAIYAIWGKNKLTKQVIYGDEHVGEDYAVLGGW